MLALLDSIGVANPVCGTSSKLMGCDLAAYADHVMGVYNIRRTPLPMIDLCYIRQVMVFAARQH